MISFNHKGNFSKLTKYLKDVRRSTEIKSLDKFGKEGVIALSAMTPVDSGKTASSWFYEIEQKKGSSIISFHNSNINNGVLIAIILQYGHGTGTGGWVEGRDYINPSIQPVFDRLANEAWMEVTKL